MRVDLTVDSDNGHRLDVAVCGPTDTRLSHVRQSLGDIARTDSASSVWVNGNLLDDKCRIGAEPILTGSVLRFGSRRQAAVARASMLELRVVGGPDAGIAVDLPLGSVTIGRAPDCTLVLTDPDSSRQHVRVRTGRDIVLVEPLLPTNQTTIDGTPVPDNGAPLRLGQVLRLGNSFLTLAGPDASPVAVVVDGGRIVITRRIRHAAELPPDTFELPARPQARARARGAVLPATVAMASGIAVAVVVRSAQLLIISIAMPLAGLAASLGEQLHARRRARRRASRHVDELAEIQSSIQTALRAEAMRLRERYPDAVTVHRTAKVRTARLWERSPEDPALLVLRVGTGDRPSAIHVTSEGTVETRYVTAVPVVVDLARGPMAMFGPRVPLIKLATSLLCQLAVLCSAADVEVIGVFTAETARLWSWLRWLPQLRRPPASSMAEQEVLASFLVEKITTRRARSAQQPRPPWLLVVIDVPIGEVHPHIVDAIASANLDVGITGVVVAAPPGSVVCSTRVALRGETGSHLRVSTPEGREDAVADLVQRRAAEGTARALAAVIDRADVNSQEQTDQTLLSLLGFIATPSGADILARWDNSDRRPSTTIGVGGGRAVSVDLVRDGPHALVAGTTGSGKSECLQAMVAGMAALHPPREVTFVLVDYKGGAAFSRCADLPHVVGLVTDLDPLLTERALRALDYELRRRERLLARQAVTEFDHYHASAAEPRPPRLVIVVDEFAALAEDAPDLLRGLISIAQRGRSLGLHLILATQRPAGVVSADIRANTSLRIALRVTDPTESIDVVGSAAAADIEPDAPGRAILNRAGGCTTVQLAQVSGRSSFGDAEPTVQPLGAWRTLPDPSTRDFQGERNDDLNVLVGAVVEAARSSDQSHAEAPWLPPLPALLSARDLPVWPRRDLVHVGVIDLPLERAQPPVALDLSAGGTLVVAGSARSGRTSTARAIALQASAQLGGDIRVTQVGSPAAGPTNLSPEAVVLDVAEFDPIVAMLDRLKARLRHGKRSAFPLELLILDDWEQFVAASEEADLGRSVETALDIARRAHTAGCTVVVTGDRGVLSPRIASTAQRVFVMRMADRADYGLVGIPRSAVPAEMAPGRALLAPNGHQVQFVLNPCVDTDDQSAVQTSP